MNLGAIKLNYTPPLRRDLGTDPAEVHALPFKLKNVSFPKAGQYTFYLACEGERIAHEHVEVR